MQKITCCRVNRIGEIKLITNEQKQYLLEKAKEINGSEKLYLEVYEVIDFINSTQIANGNQVDFFVIKNLAEDINENAKQKGFWENPNIAEKLMLIVSELGEALEADRKNKLCNIDIDGVVGWTNDEDFQKHFAENVKDTFEDEIADAFIRILDLSTFLNFDLMKHVIAKHRFNKTRPYKHGKKY